MKKKSHRGNGNFAMIIFFQYEGREKFICIGRESWIKLSIMIIGLCRSQAFTLILISLHVLITFDQYLTGNIRREVTFILAHV